jgi:hypothetical protein
VGRDAAFEASPSGPRRRALSLFRIRPGHINRDEVSVNPDSFAREVKRAEPGDLLALEKGVYRGNFVVYQKCTPARPLVIRGAARDGVILEAGAGDTCAIDVSGAEHVYLEQLTFRNCQKAVRAQGTASIVMRQCRTLGIPYWMAGAVNCDLDYNGYGPGQGSSKFGDAYFEAFRHLGRKGIEVHGKLLGPPFFRDNPAIPAESSRRMAAVGLDLHPESGAIDGGVRLPNVNHEFRGAAPDLGARETGGPLPAFGPRQTLKPE